MKTRLLIVIVFSVTLFSLSTILSAPNAFGWCTPNIDWTDGPCYGCPVCYPGLVQEKLDWEPYYDFKGKEWMESKKQEMKIAIQNNTLEDWIKLTYDTQANLNVNQYYFLNGEAPMHGMYFDQALEEEKIAKLLEIVKLEFIDFSEIYTIDEPIQFILEKTAYNNCNSYDVKITDKDGNFVWSQRIDVECNANVNPSLVTSYIKIGYNEDHPIIINESGKYYIQIEIDNIFTKREFVVRQNHSGVTLDHTVYPILSPLKQFKAGIIIDEIQCKEGYMLMVKLDRVSPVCVFLNSVEKLSERNFAIVFEFTSGEKENEN